MEKYREIQWLGRPGEAQDASYYLAELLMLDGKYVQAFKEFNTLIPESCESYYNRICDNPIKRRSAIARPDLVAITDHHLIPVIGNFLSAGDQTKYIVGTPLPKEKIADILGVDINGKNGSENNTIRTIDPGSSQIAEFNRFGTVGGWFLPFIATAAQAIGYASMEYLIPAMQRWLSRYAESGHVTAALKGIENFLFPTVPSNPPSDGRENSTA